MTVALIVSIAVAVYAMLVPSHEHAGSLAAEKVVSIAGQDATIAPGDWPNFGRTPGGDRYSPLAEITPANATKLVRAWTYHTGEFAAPAI